MILVSLAIAELPLNKKPVELELGGTCGGRLNGDVWRSSEIAGKVFSLYYIDPDEAELNSPLFEALKAENFPKDKIQSIAVINMKATWVPKNVLSMALARKQKRFPWTLYIKDNCRVVTEMWKLTDHSSDILLFNQAGEVVFSKDGKMSESQIREMIAIVWKLIGGKQQHAVQ
jgi:hypothetical protein